MKAIKVSSMGYDIVNDKNEVVGYAKKTGFNEYRLSTNSTKAIGYYSTVEECIKRLSK